MKKLTVLLLSLFILTACSSQNFKPIHTVSYVNIDRFMGDWYVIANIPTFIETDAYNAIETYEISNDGSIATTFTFNQGSADGEKKQYKPTGYIVDQESNALWDMQFIWPFNAEYRVIYLDDHYETTIIGRSKRDYVWLMARQPIIDESRYQSLLLFMQDQGYDISKIQKVPQLWPQSSANNIHEDQNL